MEIFGVGPLEFILILVLALVILGPEDMVGTARKMGQWVYRVVRSPTWRAILETSQDLRELPQKIVRDAGLEETMKEIKQTADDVKTDLGQTTQQINAEMQAATAQVNQEMRTAAQDVNAGLKEASAETQVALQTAAQGVNEGLKEASAETQAAVEDLPVAENTIAPPLAEAETAALEEAVPAPAEEPVLTPYEAQLAAFAVGLGGKEVQSAGPDEDTVFRVTPAPNVVLTTPPAQIPAEIPKKQTYVAGLETFAQALGAPTSRTQEAEKPALEKPASVETEPAPTPLAIGIPVGLNLGSSGGIEDRLKNRMDEMMKSIEKLDAKIMSTTGESEIPPTTQAEEGAPHGNGSEPAASPTRARRKKTPPTAEAAEGEAPAAQRKRTAKTTPPAAVVSEGKSLAAAPRKRAAKKTPVPETTEPDSTSTQA